MDEDSTHATESWMSVMPDEFAGASEIGPRPNGLGDLVEERITEAIAEDLSPTASASAPPSADITVAVDEGVGYLEHSTPMPTAPRPDPGAGDVGVSVDDSQGQELAQPAAAPPTGSPAPTTSGGTEEQASTVGNALAAPPTSGYIEDAIAGGPELIDGEGLFTEAAEGGQDMLMGGEMIAFPSAPSGEGLESASPTSVSISNAASSISADGISANSASQTISDASA